MDEPVVTTARILEALREQYPRSKGWAVATEVQDPTSGRRADFMAWNFWDGRTEIVEVKMSRADARNDLKNPDKSAPLARQVTMWWLACPAGVVKKSEAKERAWGLIEVQGDGVLSRYFGFLRDGDPSHDLATAFIRRLSADEALQALLAQTRGAAYLAGKKDAMASMPAARYTKKDLDNAYRRGESAERRRWKAKERKAAGGMS